LDPVSGFGQTSGREAERPFRKPYDDLVPAFRDGIDELVGRGSVERKIRPVEELKLECADGAGSA
jgi:hypothetical protein